jgi:bifunctional UDP-N-acetylglucosamine pyrophosphorylase/glucosamine-1-phosphate N-acetyltransferase
MDIGRPWDLLGANERILSNLKPQLKGTVESGAVVNGPVFLDDDAVIRSGSYIEGPAYIGEKSAIGPNCRVRPYTSIADEVHVGSSCEVKNSIVMAGSKVPHLSYVGDSVVGEQCNLAAGTITANIRLDEAPIRIRLKGKLTSSGRRKLGAIIGDGVQTGINTSIMPGVRIGPNSYIGPGVIVYEDVPANRMVLARQPLVMKTRKRRL